MAKKYATLVSELFLMENIAVPEISYWQHNLQNELKISQLSQISPEKQL
jgi:hypothetical protein